MSEDSIATIRVDYLAEPITTEPEIKVSREGCRMQKLQKKRSSYHKSNASSAMSHHSIRRKTKTVEQLDYLNNLFKKLRGNWDGKQKYEAMRKTGLTRKQIYKWFYEMKKSSLGQKILSMSDEEEQSTSNHELDLHSSSDMES
jgi:hypothetical protein